MKFKLITIPITEYVPVGKSEGWYRFLWDDVGIREPRLMDCKTVRFSRFYTHEDDCVEWFPNRCGFRRWCPDDATSYAHGEANVDMALMEELREKWGNDVILFNWVFTLPREYWERVREQDFKAFRSACFDAVTRFYSWVTGRRNIKLGLNLTNHWWSSKDPLRGGWFPHVQGDVCSLAYDVDKGEFFVLPYWLDMKGGEGKKIRSLYKYEVEKRFGNAVYGGEWDVNYLYKSHVKQMRFQFEYNGRYPIQDVYKFWAQGLYDFDVNFDRYDVARILGANMAKHFKRSQRYGWWSDRSLKKYLERLHVQVQSRLERKKEVCSKRCKHGFVYCLDYGFRNLSLERIMELNNGKIPLIRGYRRNLKCAVMLNEFDGG